MNRTPKWADDVGADSLKEDLHLTKDCVRIARHNPWRSDNTNIAAGAMVYQSNDVYNVVDGIGPWKPQVMTLKLPPPEPPNANGTPYVPSLADVNSVTPTSLISDAHKAGLRI